MGLIAAGSEAQLIDRPGGIFVRRPRQMSEEDRILLQTVARVISDDKRGTLAEQLRPPRPRRSRAPRNRRSRAQPAAEMPAAAAPAAAARPAVLQRAGRVHAGRPRICDHHRHGTATPAPWVNVLANPYFGTVVSESGGAYTWCENAHEFRLTPWYNDPVSDPSGEAFYLRDEESGQFWSPTPLPARGDDSRTSAATVSATASSSTPRTAFSTELWVFVATDAPVKFAVLKLRNLSGRPRRLSATAYCEWVLGDLRAKSLHARHHGGRPRNRRAVRAQPLQHRVRRPRCLPRRARCRAHA